MDDKLLRSITSFFIMSVAAIGLAAPATSADLGAGEQPLRAEPVAAPSPWSFTFTTYGWLPWLSGDMTIKGRSLTVDVTPDQVIDALDWSGLPMWMSYSEARNGRLALFNDIVYSKLAGSGDFTTSAQRRLVSATLSGNVQADYEQATIEVGGAYEVWSGGEPASSGSTALDLLGGGRYWHQELNVSADLNATLAIGGGLAGLTVSGNRVFAKSGSVDWVDPFVGARLRHHLAPGHDLALRGDVGGFGAGSDFTWQVIATYNMQLCVSDSYVIDAYLGYRALSVDYSQGSGNTKYEYDVLQQGPVIGMTLHF